MMIAAVVLAAGSSSRLGQPKQDLRFGPETLLQRCVRIAHLAGLDPVLVVTAPDHSPELDERARILVNHSAAEGMASSIRTGIAAAVQANADAVVILACDQPSVTAGHLRDLSRGANEIVASAYAGRKGIPAYFPAKEFEGLMNLHGDVGARDLVREAQALDLPHGELDIDTVEDLKLARKLYPETP
jgi:CTP:molybdopterin cytidylyltransferase MocA